MERAKILDSLLVATIYLQIAATIPVCLLMAGPATAGRPALVLAPPWGVGATAIVAKAGGQVIGPFTAPIGQLAVFEDPARARQAGAWAVLDAGALASICGIGENLK